MSRIFLSEPGRDREIGVIAWTIIPWQQEKAEFSDIGRLQIETFRHMQWTRSIASWHFNRSLLPSRSSRFSRVAFHASLNARTRAQRDVSLRRR